MNIERAKTINGWMDDEELKWLAVQAQKSQCIIELGCAYGRSTCALVDNMQTGVVIAIDTWNGSPASIDIHHKDFRLRQGDEAYLQFLENHWAHIKTGRLIPLRMNGANAAKFLQTRIRANFIFIDADHDYEAVKADLLNFRPLLQEGGVFAGHDFNHPHWPGVTQAVNEILPQATQPVGWIWQL